MTEFDQDIIVALADNGMVASRAGKALYMTHTAICYRMKKIRESTGLDPWDFHDLCILYAMVCRERKKDAI